MDSTCSSDDKLTVAIIEGFHPFEAPQWNRFWRSFGEFECVLQHIDNWAVDGAQCRRDYDVVLFYNMNMAMTESSFEEALAGAIAQLGEGPQGIVLLHHAILAYPESPVWSAMAGIEDRSFGYHPDQDFVLEIAAPEHPIAKGLGPARMHDETYTMAEPDADSEVLFTVDHDPSMTALGWVRQYRDARVFCFQPGHDHLAYENPAFRDIVRRGILWCAGHSLP